MESRFGRRKPAHVSAFALSLTLAALAGALPAQASNGVYGGYVGSSSWFASMERAAQNQAMLRSLGGAGSQAAPGAAATVPPGYVEIAGSFTFADGKNPFPDGRLPDLKIDATDKTLDPARRSPFIAWGQTSFYAVLKRGVAYDFSWMSYLGTIWKFASWTVPADASGQSKLVIALDSRGMGQVAQDVPVLASPPSPAPPAPPANAALPPTNDALPPSDAALPPSDAVPPPPDAAGAVLPPADSAPPPPGGSSPPPPAGAGVMPPNAAAPPANAPAPGSLADNLTQLGQSLRALFHHNPAPAPDPNQFDTSGIPNPGSTLREMAVWSLIRNAVSPADKAAAHAKLAAYYRDKGLTRPAAVEDLRAQYWIKLAH